MKTIKDDIGSYEIPTTNPIDIENKEAIYLNLFNNEGNVNGAAWKVSLNAIDETGHRYVYCAGVLNKFEPARWFRNIPTEYREKSFYQDWLAARTILRNANEVGFDVKPTAGFFYCQDVGHDSPYNTAYAYMWKEKDKNPRVGVRFWDYTCCAELTVNEYKKGRGPGWTSVVKQKAPKGGMIDGWS